MSASTFRIGLHVTGPTHSPRVPVDWVSLLIAAATATPPFDPMREQYATAFHFDKTMLAHLKANGGSSAGFTGPVWSMALRFDLDAADDLAPALDAGRRLTATLLERYRVLSEDDLEIFYSGSRSIHVELPLPHRPEPGPAFHLVCRKLAFRLSKLAGLDSVRGVKFDEGNYDKVRLWRLNPTLKAVITCCEMPAKVLLDRQLSRLSGVLYSRIRNRELTETDSPAVATGLATLNEIRERVAFHIGPFELSAVAEAADGFEADLIVIDYLQRLNAPGQHRDKRSQTNATLDTLRAFASAGRGLLVLSSVGRQPNKQGRSGYTGLSLASFKESGDIEYAADDAFILTQPEGGWATLQHVKARHTEMADIPLRCDLIGNAIRAGRERHGPAGAGRTAQQSPQDVGERHTERGCVMPAVPTWSDAKPLTGCEVVPRTPPDSRPAREAPGRGKPNAVVKKLSAANRFLDCSARSLSPAAALVWVLLWRDERDGTARTAVSDLARRSGLSPSTVKRALRALRERGFVAPVRRGTPTTGPTLYRLRPTSPQGVTDGP